MTDLHQPATDPNQKVLERLADLENRVSQLGIAQGIAGSEGKGMRVVAGVGDGAGNVTQGLGWSYGRFAAGVYVVTFSPAFSVKPVVVAQALSGTFLIPTVQNGVTTSSAQLQFGDRATGANTDTAFNFIAYGAA